MKMEIEIIDYETLHKISENNIFRWSNNVSYEYTENTHKKIVIQDLYFKTLAKFTYTDKETIIKQLPRSAEFFRYYISREDIIEVIINNPPIAIYTDISIFDKVVKGLIKKWGINSITNSIKGNLNHNFNNQLFFTRLSFYLYRYQAEKLYNLILTNVYDKDLINTLLLYIDTEN